jgi:tight adherence protein C
MEIVVAIIVFLTVAAVIFLFGAAASTPLSVLGARLRTLGGDPGKRAAETPQIRERIEQALDPFSKALPLSANQATSTRLMLMQAGYREAKDVTFYTGLRVFGAILGLAICLLTGIGITSPLLLLGGPLLGFILPRFLLKRAIAKRQMRIRLGLPDALDLTVICVEAGLGLDQALMRVAADLDHAHPELSDELRLVNLEMRAGKPRTEAMRNWAQRTGVDDIRSLVGVLIQTDRFGTSIAQALRIHSDSLRTERRQRAEEQAAKTTIKLVPPLVVFVLPSVIFVTLGPAVIQLIRTVFSEGGH